MYFFRHSNDSPIVIKLFLGKWLCGPPLQFVNDIATFKKIKEKILLDNNSHLINFMINIVHFEGKGYNIHITNGIDLF